MAVLISFSKRCCYNFPRRLISDGERLLGEFPTHVNAAARLSYGRGRAKNNNNLAEESRFAPSDRYPHRMRVDDNNRIIYFYNILTYDYYHKNDDNIMVMVTVVLPTGFGCWENLVRSC